MDLAQSKDKEEVDIYIQSFYCQFELIKLYQFLACGSLDLKYALTSAYSQVKAFKSNGPYARN